MNLEKDTYLFLRSKRESSAILVGLIPDSRLYQQDFLSYYIIYPISDFLLHPSHTPLFRSYSETFCEGCEGISFTSAGGTAHYASTRRFTLESQELTDIQVDVGIVKDLKRNKYIPTTLYKTSIYPSKIEKQKTSVKIFSYFCPIKS